MPLHQKPFSLNSLNKSKPQTFCSREKHSAPAAQNTGEMTYSDIERNVTTNIRSLFVNYQINAGICHSIKSIFVDVDKHTHTQNFEFHWNWNRKPHSDGTDWKVHYDMDWYRCFDHSNLLRSQLFRAFFLQLYGNYDFAKLIHIKCWSSHTCQLLTVVLQIRSICWGPFIGYHNDNISLGVIVVFKSVEEVNGKETWIEGSEKQL